LEKRDWRIGGEISHEILFNVSKSPVCERFKKLCCQILMFVQTEMCPCVVLEGWGGRGAVWGGGEGYDRRVAKRSSRKKSCKGKENAGQQPKNTFKVQVGLNPGGKQECYLYIRRLYVKGGG